MSNFYIDRYGRIIRDNIPVNNSSRPTNSRPYNPPPVTRNDPQMPPVLFYLLTLGISAIAAWLLSAFVGVNVFSSSKGGISGFFNTIGPYLIFLGGITGSLWYNISRSDENNIKEIFLSIVSGIAGCVIFGIGAFLLSIIVQIIIVLIVIAIAISFFGG